MGIRALAAADNRVILADVATGAAFPITVTDPLGTSAALTGISDDISQAIDPDTGQAVSGRLASAVLNIAELTAAGLGLPVGVADSSVKPWLVDFDDINGNAFTFKVSESNPDRMLGSVTLLLELYEV